MNFNNSNNILNLKHTTECYSKNKKNKFYIFPFNIKMGISVDNLNQTKANFICPNILNMKHTA